MTRKIAKSDFLALPGVLMPSRKTIERFWYGPSITRETLVYLSLTGGIETYQFFADSRL